MGQLFCRVCCGVHCPPTAEDILLKVSTDHAYLNEGEKDLVRKTFEEIIVKSPDFTCLVDHIKADTSTTKMALGVVDEQVFGHLESEIREHMRLLAKFLRVLILRLHMAESLVASTCRKFGKRELNSPDVSLSLAILIRYIYQEGCDPLVLCAWKKFAKYIVTWINEGVQAELEKAKARETAKVDSPTVEL